MKSSHLSVLLVLIAATLAGCERGSHRSARPDVSARGSGVSRDAGVLNHGASDMNSGGFQDPYNAMPPPVNPR